MDLIEVMENKVRIDAEINDIRCVDNNVPSEKERETFCKRMKKYGKTTIVQSEKNTKEVIKEVEERLNE